MLVAWSLRVCVCGGGGVMAMMFCLCTFYVKVDLTVQKGAKKESQSSMGFIDHKSLEEKYLSVLYEFPLE